MTAIKNPELRSAAIPPTVLSGLVEIGLRDGLAITSWFMGTGLDPAELMTSQSVFVSYGQTATILRRAIRSMPRRPLGMQVGGRDILLSMGILGVAMSTCATLQDAVAVALEFHQASGSLVDVEFEEYEDEISLLLSERAPDPELEVFLFEEALSTTLVFVRSIFGAEQSPVRVELPFTPPPYSEEYRRFFRCPILFESNACRIVFHSNLQKRALPNHNEQTRAVAIDACQRLLNLDSRKSDVVTTVEMLLLKNLRNSITMESVAQCLHMTERTLRRQLSDAGESFSTIRDRARERRATFLLQESALKIDSIAREVGFNEVRDFRRAYVRWTGMTPSSVRRAFAGNR
ncbi:AraC family transcriptional regulator ligand-binding domain-containing protein [Nocardia sp. NPDC059246]|uniref:AraC family transcriptional regulator n=1 Tax=unclassified Nocardia TaxID=2637762 RepID=UPI0036841891